MSVFTDTIIDEAFERQVRHFLAKTLKSAATRGENGGQAAKSVLGSFFHPQGEFMRQYAKVAGFSIPVLGTAIAGIMKKPGFFDSILPDDNRPGVRQVKFLLKNIAPAFAIGASEAYGDAIKRAVDTKVSDPVTTAEKDRTKPFDRPVISRLIPGRVFVAEVHDDGRIKEIDGLPAISDPEWCLALNTWKASNAREKFPFEYITFEMAADIAFGGGASAVDVDKLAALRAPALTSAKTGYGSLSEDTIAVLLAFTATMSKMNIFDYDQAEDLVKDMFVQIDPEKVNLLARFKRFIENGEFSEANYRRIETFIDAILGGERDWTSRARRAFKNFVAEHGGVSSGSKSVLSYAKWILAWIWAYARWLVIIGLFPVLAFIVFFFMAGLGTFGFDPDPSLSKDAQLIETTIKSLRCLIIGTWGMLICLTFLKLVDLAVKPIGKWVGIGPGAFAHIGRKISTIIGVYGFLMVTVKISAIGTAAIAFPHYMLLAAAAGMYGAMMGLVSAGWIGLSKIWVMDGMSAIKKIVTFTIISALALATLTGLIRSGLNPLTWASAGWDGLWGYFYKNPILASIVLLLLYALGVGIVVRLTERLRSFTRNGTLYVNELGFLPKLAIFLAGIAVVLLPWMPYEKWPEAEKDVPAATTQAVPTALAPASSGTRSVAVPRPATVKTHRTKPEPQCDEIPFHLRKYVARCQGTGYR